MMIVVHVIDVIEKSQGIKVEKWKSKNKSDKKSGTILNDAIIIEKFWIFLYHIIENAHVPDQSKHCNSDANSNGNQLINS